MTRWPIALAAGVSFYAAAAVAPAVAADSFQVRDIDVVGLERMEVGTVYNYLPVKPGQTVGQKEIDDILRKLFATGFFQDVQIRRQGDTLVVVVQERPAIADITISGADVLPEDAIRDSLKAIGLAERQAFNVSSLDLMVAELEREYFGQGYYSAKIEAEVEELERNRVAIAINILEGKPARIGEVTIVGNDRFTLKELRDAFALKESNWLSFFREDDRYSREKLVGDLESLRSYYLDRGYLDFRIESTQVTVSPDREKLYITANVYEGERYKIGEVTVSGESELDPGEAREMVVIKTGDWFSRKKLTESSKNISNSLGDIGFAFANVDARPRVDQEARIVDLDFHLEPGRKVYIRRIIFSGNNRTRDYVLRREFRQLEGAYYQGSQIRRSKERLNRMEFFEEVSLETKPVPGLPDQVDVEVSVVERPTAQFLFTLGYSNAQGAVFSSSITEKNLRGRGQTLSIGATLGGLYNTYSLDFDEPFITADGVSLGLSTYRTDTDTDSLDIGSYREVVTGGGFRLGVPINEYLRMGYSLFYDYTELELNIDSPEPFNDYVDEYGTTASALKFGVNLTHDTRDSLLYPTKGWYNRVKLESALPVGDLRFYRAELESQYYHPLFWEFVGTVNLEYGVANGYSGRDVPFFENFFLGGPTSVRGYDTYSLGPKVDDYTVGGTRKVQANAEVLFPFPGMTDNKSFRASLFFDTGWVFDDDYLPQVADLRKSVGFGVYWLSPLGPLRVSFAQPLGAKEDDDKEPLQFSVGTSF